MKKFFALLAIVALLLPSCQKINDRLDAIDNRLDNIEGTQIASLQQQIDAINTTLPQLKQMDAELKNYIESLQTTSTGLQQQIIYIGEDIDDLEDTLDQAVSDAEDADNALKAELMSQLQSTKSELEAELTLINSSIETLTEADAELEQKITVLEEYVNTELKNTEDWASATFATLEQYNSICTEVATIKQNIETLTSSITELEERINTKIANDIAVAAATIDATIQAKVTEITNAYTSAISTATDEITEAYTAAIATSIANLESSMKEWVNDQLTGYYTIAEIDAQVEILIELYKETGHEQLSKDLESLKGALQTLRIELVEAYNKAIEEAINTNNGVINSKIAGEITTVNTRIDGEVATLNAQINEITSRLDTVEGQISDLLSRIQSVTYVPQYSDGKATMDYNTKSAEFDFIISPKDAVPTLASVWEDALSMKAIYTQTRAVEFIDLPITNFEADAINGVISLTVSGENLKDEFYCELQDASAFLQISDGNSNITSEYVAMTPNYNIQFEDIRVKAICCLNWDTNNDNQLSYKEAAAVTSIEVAFKANTEIAAFDELKYFISLTDISDSAFDGCTSLCKVSLPHSITKVSNKAFHNCSSLYSIEIPEKVTHIGEYAFNGCSSLKNIKIPSSLSSIDISAFGGSYPCKNVYITDLSSWCNIDIKPFCSSNPLSGGNLYLNGELVTDLVIPKDVATISKESFGGCKSLVNITISSNVEIIDEYAFIDCPNLLNVSILEGVTTIGIRAFDNCTSLVTVTIPCSIKKLGWRAFCSCDNLKYIYCKATIPPTPMYYDTKKWELFNIYNTSSGLKIYVPHGYLQEYKSADGWKSYQYDIYEYDFENNIAM